MGFLEMIVEITVGIDMDEDRAWFGVEERFRDV
jgi:hypothetical protein